MSAFEGTLIATGFVVDSERMRGRLAMCFIVMCKGSMGFTESSMEVPVDELSVEPRESLCGKYRDSVTYSVTTANYRPF